MSHFRLSLESAPWGHTHIYPRRGVHVSPRIWHWCPKCYCYISGECDHRRSICRRRLTELRRKRAKS